MSSCISAGWVNYLLLFKRQFSANSVHILHTALGKQSKKNPSYCIKTEFFQIVKIRLRIEKKNAFSLSVLVLQWIWQITNELTQHQIYITYVVTRKIYHMTAVIDADEDVISNTYLK